MQARWVPKSGPPPVWGDFNASVAPDGIRLMPKTLREIEELGLQLEEGLVLNVWDEDVNEHGDRDDLIAVGVIEREDGSGEWTLQFTECGHESDLQL
jgi:hypothetical protein